MLIMVSDSNSRLGMLRYCRDAQGCEFAAYGVSAAVA
jgi:hypothetical protein